MSTLKPTKEDIYNEDGSRTKEMQEIEKLSHEFLSNINDICSKLGWDFNEMMKILALNTPEFNQENVAEVDEDEKENS